MKKLLILSFILLSTQLYGCSQKAPETDEVVSSTSELPSPDTETVSVEDNDTYEFETSDEEFHDDDSEISTEQRDDSAPAVNTESTDASAGEISLPSEETAAMADDNYYSAATDIPRSEVESYAALVKQWFLEHDWSAISSEISYPVTIADVTYNNSAEFLDAANGFDSDLDEAFFAALEEEDCVEMFCSWEGIMLGNAGQIWISEVLDEEFNSQGLKIIAVNGLLKN